MIGTLALMTELHILQRVSLDVLQNRNFSTLESGICDLLSSGLSTVSARV